MTTDQDIASYFRLSPQQRLRWRSVLPPPVLVLDTRGKLRVSYWQQQLERLAAAMQPLRARLHLQPGLNAPLQTIGDPAVVTVEEAPPDASSTVCAHASGEPVIRVYLLNLTEDHHQLHLHLPPLSADRGTLLRLARVLANAPSDEHGEETPYSHYTAWLYELQDDEDAEEGRQFWQRQCPRHWQPKGLVYQQNTCIPAQLAETSQAASSALDQALASFCATQGPDIETVLSTAWASVLQRLSLDSDPDSAVPLGWVHDCRRDYEELADTWGLFSKTLPLFWQVAADETFQVAIARMEVRQEKATEWQEYYAIEHDPDAAHCRFGFEWGGVLPPSRAVDSGAGSNSTNLVTISGLRAHNQWFELLLTPVRDAQGQLHFYLYYDTASYTRQAATVLLEQYQSLLLDAVANPDRPLATLSMYSETFEKTLQNLENVQAWSSLGKHDLYPARFSQTAGDHAHRSALVGSDNGGTTLSYRELEARSNQLAHLLRAQELGAESRVALYLDRSVELVVAILAVLKSGAAFVPLETRQPAARTLAILEEAGPELIVCSAAQPAPSLAGAPLLVLDNMPLTNQPTTPPPVVIDPKQAAYILFTSGSTGTPKGVVVAHQQLQNYVTSILSRVPLEAGEKSAIVTSLAADLSYTLLFTSLLSGGELHIIDRDTTLDPEAWDRYQRRHAIDHLKVVPSLLDAWLTHHDVSAVLPVRQLILGGEACKPGLLNTLHKHASGIQLYNHYGPTETTVGVMIHKVGYTLPNRGLPLTDRLDHTQIYILDEALNPVTAGKTGELYIAGANLARGYLCLQQTADRFIRNPFRGSGKNEAGDRLYRSGDLARYFPDGSIELLGRADRQVKIRGYRIELDEIETLLSDLSAVNQAAVVTVPRQQGDLQMFAFLTLKPEEQVGIAQLQGQLQDRLPDYMVPTLRLVDNLPLMANGKLDRQNLSQQAGNLLKQSGSAPPRTALEEVLAKLWAEALGLEKVGVEDNFFAVGGHSLAAVKLASRMQATLGFPTKVNMIFTAPTVEQFAQLVTGEMNLSPLVPLSNDTGSDKRKVFCFHPSTGHLQDYRHLPELLPCWQWWGVQASYLTDGAQATPDSLETLARKYLNEVRRKQPAGPYYLLGWSLGGLLAITVAGLIEAAGEQVAFLGVVDSQPTVDALAQDIEQLLEWAEDEFDSDSRRRLRHLAPAQRAELVAALNRAEQEQWPFVLLHWARQQGMQLESDSWQHAEAREQRHAHTRRLIANFNPPLLQCSMTAWWATDTLASPKPPADWQNLTRTTVQVRTIAGHHFDILQKAEWQQQLRAALDQAAEVHPSLKPRAPTLVDAHND